MKKTTLEEKLEKHIKVGEPDECWEWQGALRKHNGYGVTTVGGRLVMAHRAAWIAVNGEIPDGLLVLHNCHNPACCNVHHLRLGTQKENMKDAWDIGHGKIPAYNGERSGACKLTDAQVADIRASDRPNRELAKLYGVHYNQIYRIRAYKSRIRETVYA